ncbi:MAG: HAMP domain-containing histidine kinase [Rhodoferax sp.]|uniref:sensor histidine kinase n=1 Tax=Rhodoferax sp. TaxID=50421 RepID=UPI001B681A21|nr:HAMP domain-containing sensor histidine kinase [Rhodoferax sp.]MBP8287760.1 HAMP domain-containing histidine kinase [Rhodoferax sp.]MBP9735191.1 HAMP domain-containing histidine kinase [Rhodoferax sp.]
MLNKLYFRIWLAVVLAVAVLTLLVGWIWRMAAEPPLRDVVVRNEAGQVIGRGRRPLAPNEITDRPELESGPQWRQRSPEDPASRARGSRGRGPRADADHDMEPGTDQDRPGGTEFMVRMHDGQTMRMRFLRAPPSIWSRPPFGFAWMLVWVGIAVALATYPIVRTLTRRLEGLQDGVKQWGDGDLSARVPETGHDEVAFLARRFNHAAERIQTLVQSHESLLASQKSLLANASHELRSPLARIRIGLELLGPAASVEFKSEIARNINELDQLIEEILLASRLDAREADMGTVESVDLIGLAAEECARVGAELDIAASNAGTTDGSGATELAVQGVAKLLRRAVRNLLENARRHAAGEIRLQLAQRKGTVVLRVCDRGPGVPSALQERIFEPFYRLPGATERDGGVGLGLALVKSITLRHGGRVFCEDHPGGGACFVIELPQSVKPTTVSAPE